MLTCVQAEKSQLVVNLTTAKRDINIFGKHIFFSPAFYYQKIHASDLDTFVKFAFLFPMHPDNKSNCTPISTADKEVEYAKQAHMRTKEIKALRERYCLLL